MRLQNSHFSLLVRAFALLGGLSLCLTSFELGLQSHADVKF